jgi:hypothetical protein
MNETLKDIPIEERPCIPIFPLGAVYLRTWRTLRWFILLCLPIISSAVSLWFRGHGLGVSLFFGFFGVVVSAWIFVSLCSGAISSTWGTHLRASEPFAFWAQVTVGAIVYLGMSIAGYLL